MLAERAVVIPEVGPMGNLRFRCEVCNKVAFMNEAIAMEAARQISKRTTYRFRHYKGRYRREHGQNKGIPCGWWHLSGNPHKY